jgi:hypothetical protein
MSPSPRAQESDPYMKESYQQMLQMTMELVEDVTQNWHVGDAVLTQYGSGHVMDHPPNDKSTLGNHKSGNRRSTTGLKIKLDWGGVMYCPQISTLHKVLSPTEYQHAMEHLEQVRRLNVSIQSHDWGLPAQHELACVACLFRKPPCYSTTRRQRFFHRSSSSSLATSSSTTKVTTKTKPCDVCGNPVCNQHKVTMGSSAEGVEFFTMCTDCSHDLNETEHNLNAHHPELLLNLQRLNQYYTRMVLQLSYCVPSLRMIGYELTHIQKRDGAVGLGNSALGFAGAALGVAGAVAMLTPAGPALLLAAVATSATSGTFQGAYASYNMLSSKTPQQLADRCLGWHGLCLGILDSLEQLRQDLIEQEHDFMDTPSSSTGNNNSAKKKQSLEIWNSLALGSFTTTRNAMTGIGVTSSMGASYSQAISTGLSTLPVVGAAFSIGCMAVDGKCFFIRLRPLTSPSISIPSPFWGSFCRDLLSHLDHLLFIPKPLANNMASCFKQLNTPAKKALALLGVEQSFLRHIVNSISPKVDMIMHAVDDLQERIREQRRLEEAALIEHELQGLERMENDDELERELANL